MDSYQWGRGKGIRGENGTGIKKHKWQVQNRQEDVKNSTGNGEARELNMHKSPMDMN